MIPITEHHIQPGTTLESLYEAYQGPLMAHLIRLVDDRSTAEDLCQETFLKVLRAWDSGAPIVNVGAWLYRIATNTAYDHLRRRRCIHFTELRESMPAPSGAHSMESRVNEQEPVRLALDQLPLQYRELLVLRDGAGHSTEEIADVLGCSRNAVRLRLFRARERFRKAYLMANDAPPS
jgi:RNA polymerase sigma-70 factor (ECF subfamily)